MKKSRILTAAVVAAMVSLGAGYAAWTDALTITNTVSTGTLDVDFEVDPKVSWNTNNNDVAIIDKVDASENDATIKLKNLYPGAKATVLLPIINRGTIPVKGGEFKLYNVDTTLLDVQVKNNAVELAKDGGKGTVELTIEVKDVDNGKQNKTTTFEARAIYQQFNK